MERRRSAAVISTIESCKEMVKRAELAMKVGAPVLLRDSVQIEVPEQMLEELLQIGDASIETRD